MTELKYIGLVGIILVVVVAALILTNQNLIDTPPIIKSTDKASTFKSLDELKTFVKERSEFSSGRGFDSTMETFATGVPSIAGASKSQDSSEGSRSSDSSQTNVQVEGVDEPDIVKNDDKYIYSVTGNKVIIVNAYPAQSMKIASEINISNYIRNIFVNGDKLIIFTEKYDDSPIVYAESAKIAASSGVDSYMPRRYNTPKTNILVYDISDRTNPRVDKDILADGSYTDARMINDYVYVISTKWIQYDAPVLPAYSINGAVKEIMPTDIHYFDYYDSNYVFTNIMALNVETSELNSEVYLTGSSAAQYVSENNIYLSYLKRINPKEYTNKLMKDVIVILPAEEQTKANNIYDSDKTIYQKWSEIQGLIQDYSDSLTGKEKADFDKAYYETLNKFEEEIRKETEKTVIHKINVNKDVITYMSKGEVPGTILNQFSMDEFNGKFRIATTTGNVWEGNSLNNIYVLDENLDEIGSVEDLAKGEKIYSTRFMGNRAYMVTFKKVDPFYVIDLSNPESPKVLGYLKIPGFSDYLHPYDENHVIGIGKEAVDASEEEVGGRNLDFAWYQGLKISIFDVSDVANPKETAKIVIGDRGTDSYALHDHKAFLFDKKKGIIVIPVSLAKIDRSKYPDGEIPTNTYGETVWQGAYVLNVKADEISLRGKITHQDDDLENKKYGYWYYGGMKEIQRSLYMDNYLYTISQSRIKANDLTDMQELKVLDI